MRHEKGLFVHYAADLVIVCCINGTSDGPFRAAAGKTISVFALCIVAADDVFTESSGLWEAGSVPIPGNPDVDVRFVR